MAAKHYIYRNLRTGGFSVRHRGLVADRFHPDDTSAAFGVSFKVNELGRQRVLHERQKNVHAFVVAEGYATCLPAQDEGKYPEIKYNPYTRDCFTIYGAKIETAEIVLFARGKCYLVMQCP